GTSSTLSSLFSFTAPASPAIYTLSLHDALPIFRRLARERAAGHVGDRAGYHHRQLPPQLFEHLVDREERGFGIQRIEDGFDQQRSEEHTSELQSRENLVCRLLLEKKNNKKETTV